MNELGTDPPKRPTMRDVADLAGVSLKTVSRVVNDEPGVTPDLVDRVRGAVLRLGYRPDDRARHLRRTAAAAPSRSRTIGYVQMDVANPFFAGIFRGLEDVAGANDSLVLAGSSDADPAREEALIQAFVARRVDGLIIATQGDFDVGSLELEQRHGTAVVFVDQDPEQAVGDVVRTDHYEGAALAVRHLRQHGHQRIAFLGDDLRLFSARARHQGFLDVMEADGLATPWVETELTNADQAATATRRLLAADDRPTAMFTAQNLITTGVLSVLHVQGLADQIALVGFDQIEAADLIKPRPTVIPQDPRQLGRLAAERLFARLAGDTSPPARTILRPHLLVGGSGEIPPPD